MQPFRLKRWKIQNLSPTAYFFTCARPGRLPGQNTKSKKKKVSDAIVSEWICGLPKPKTVIVSLLGRKPKDNRSEFSVYTFCGGWDTDEERGNKPTLEEWISQKHKNLHIIVREHPTYDLCEIPHNELRAIKRDVRELIIGGHSVIVVDSGWVGRTGQVRRFLDATEVPLDSFGLSLLG